MKAIPGRTRLNVSVSIAVAFALLLGAVRADAVFLSPAQKCQLGKLKAAGKYHFCRVKVMAKSFKFGSEPDFSRCDKKLLKKWVVLEEKAIAKGIPCPSEGDLLEMQARLTNDSTDVDKALTGIRFLDNGDGTISDTMTGLMWEKKEPGSGCLHCVEDTSSWVDLAEWLSEVNGHTDDPDMLPGLAGHSDWRIANSVELQTLLLEPFPCGESPCVMNELGPMPTVPMGMPIRYWTSTTSAITPTAAWLVDFDDGLLVVGGKMGAGVYYRAVRGGL